MAGTGALRTPGDAAERLCTVERRAGLCYHGAMAATDDPVLTRFRAALDAAYGDRIERVVLFGSRARGDARPDSDYDVAVFLEEYRGFSAELDPLVTIETDILWDSGIVVNALPLVSGSYHDRTALMFEMRRDGIDL